MARKVRKMCKGWCYLICMLLAFVLMACHGKMVNGNGTEEDGLSKTDSMELGASSVGLSTPRYARGFSVTYLEDSVRLVTVFDPQQESAAFRFVLVPRSMSEKDLEETLNRHHVAVNEWTAIRVPIRGCITMTSLQLSNFTVLDAHSFLCGITSTKNLFDRDIRERVKERKIVKIGMEGNFDVEKVMAARPDIIFISPFKRGGYENLRETGVTLVPHLGYKELSPLGQAEWVRFVGMFLGRETKADSVFRDIEKRYNRLKQRVKVARLDSLPTVFSGEMHGGNWFAVGGKNYLAQMFADAGAEYILKDDPHSGGVPIDYETMYAQAAHADFWRILNSYHGDFSYEALRASNSRNADFRAFQRRQVIYCNMKQRPYYELAPVEPDVVLADLVAAFHPELMPKDYTPTFYEVLR